MHHLIDWSRPWYGSVRAAAESLPNDWLPSLNTTSQQLGLTNHRGVPLRFVSQETLPAGTAYEHFISDTGQVPTRDNLHDYFNALVWLSFPRIKRTLNALQAAEISRNGIHARRGPVRDAATLFDENAALVIVRHNHIGMTLVEWLRQRQWLSLFHTRRADCAQHLQCWLFGHALMEKLLSPYKAITSHAWVLMADAPFFELSHAQQQQWIDQQLTDELLRLGSSGFKPSCLTPLPVSGIPGWWPDQDEAFYLDAGVFRPLIQPIDST